MKHLQESRQSSIASLDSAFFIARVLGGMEKGKTKSLHGGGSGGKLLKPLNFLQLFYLF
jgi:hypothetical protein